MKSSPKTIPHVVFYAEIKEKQKKKTQKTGVKPFLQIFYSAYEEKQKTRYNFCPLH